ncbi:MAG: rod shape-determining protein [Parcubacteria group bacterium]|nr:rod shape-determining protein [Parcubacteria group bacterium]
MFNRLFSVLTRDIGIDLGTANTIVYVKGKGIVINEPSVVAVNLRTKRIVAIGNEAKRMVGRTPAHIVAKRPLVDGVISDFETTEEMLRYFISRVHLHALPIMPKPQVVIGIPSGVTEVEKKAVEDAAVAAGARRAYLIEEPMAAAIGARLPVQDPGGSMVVDIGGGTTEVAVISLGGIVISKSLRTAGDELNENIVSYARERFNLHIGIRMAEDIKIAIGSAYPLTEKLEAAMRGRDLITGLPREVIVDDAHIREALAKSVKLLVEHVKAAIEETPPELISDIMHRGILLAGGGALLRGIDILIHEQTRIPTYVADDPITCVARGTGIVLEDIESLRDVLVPSQFETRPR